MPASAPDRPSPRERLLAAADHLFYAEGICTVGVDRILKEADVARASLYTTYGSKDELVRAYLQHRSDTWRAFVNEALPRRWESPRERILGMFTLLIEGFEAPDYHGCPFIRANAEAGSGDAVREVSDAHRAWVQGLFADLGRQAGAEDAEALAAELVLLYDGSMVGAHLDGGAAPGEAARVAAAALVDDAVAG